VIKIGGGRPRRGVSGARGAAFGAALSIQHP